MIPNNIKPKKEQEQQKFRIGCQAEHKFFQLPPQEYRSQNMQHSPTDNYLEGYLKKNHLDAFQHHGFQGSNFDEINQRYQMPFDDSKNMFMMEGYQYQSYLPMGHPWYINGNNFTEHIKQEEQDQPKFWHRDIKDQFSHDNHHYDQGFHAIDLKQQQNYVFPHKFISQDVNKFLGFSQPSNYEQKNRYRRMKVEAFLKKKKQRSFEKKIIYRCRKQVADNRVRYKGRFISLKQAIQILNLDPKKQYEPAFLKEMIENSSKPQSRKTCDSPQAYVKKEQIEKAS